MTAASASEDSTHITMMDPILWMSCRIFLDAIMISLYQTKVVMNTSRSKQLQLLTRQHHYDEMACGRKSTRNINNMYHHKKK